MPGLSFQQLQKMGASFSAVPTPPVTSTGMRTDRNNNPTAMTTDVARVLGLKEGQDYVQGDSFSNGKYYTAKLLGDPVATTTKALDTAVQSGKKAFYTDSGQQRWTHTALTNEQWSAMTPDQKRATIGQMYQKEGGSGQLMNGNAPKGLTLQQLQQMGASFNGGKSPYSPEAQTQMSNVDQLKQKYGVTPQPTQPQEDYLTHLANTPQRIWEDYKNSAQGMVESVKGGLATQEKGGVGNFLRGSVQGGLGLAGNFINSVFAPIGEVASGLIPHTGNETIDATTQGAAAGAALGGVPGAVGGAALSLGFHAVNAAQNYLMQNPKFAQFAKENPDVLPDFNNALSVVAAAFGEKKLGEKTASGKPGIADAPLSEAGATMGENLANTGKAVTEIPNKIGKGLEDKYVKQEVSFWEKPSTIPKASYNKATDVFNNATENGHNAAETIVKNKITSAENVTDGNFDTSASQDKLIKNAGELSYKGLRPSLERADFSTPPTPVIDVINATITDIENSKGITPGNRAKQIEAVKTEGKALADTYPDGMKLTNMHDTKIDYASNGRYSPVNDPAVNNSAAVNRAFGRTLAKLVETKAPADIPVHEFNYELQKQYQAADYLGALDGKKVPRSMLAKIAHAAAKATGAAAGSAMGGGFFGAGAGYYLGGMLESMLEGMSNPVKQHFLKNLETTDPAAFKAVSDYMAKSNASAETITKLPAPSGIENPIPLGSESGLMDKKAEVVKGKGQNVKKSGYYSRKNKAEENMQPYERVQQKNNAEMKAFIKANFSRK